MRLRIAIAVIALAVVSGGLFERQDRVAEAQDAPELTGDVIVKFRDGTTLGSVGAALDQSDTAPVQATSSGALLLEPEDGQSVGDALASLNADPNVAYAEPDVLVSIDATPNDTYYSNQAWHFGQINAPSGWDVETGVTSTVIAVIDTGVQSAHPDLNGNMVSGQNFVTVPVGTSSAGGSGRIRINTTTPHPYLNGEQVTISGHSVGAANGTRTITVPPALNISSSTVSAGTITVTTTAAHGLAVGNFVMVRDHSIGAANGQWTVTATPSSTQFRYSCSPDCTTGSGTGGVAKQASYFDLNGTTYTSGGTSGNALNTSPRDDEGHGTFVAGLVAAESNNNQGGAGVCWTCKIMPVKVLGATGSGSSLAVAAGIEWAVDNGADVLNLSLSSASGTQAMQDAVDYAWDNGVIVVAASGNENSSVKYPAAYPDAIAVGATDSDGLRASFSNFGAQLDIVAPGEGVMSTLGTGFGDSGGWYGFGSGTSFAAPHVAGVVGLMISYGITNKTDIVNALTSSAQDAGTAGFDTQYGHGIVDVEAALGGGDTPPVVAITTPTEGAAVSGNVMIVATASDDVAVQRLWFYVDDVLIRSDAAPPYAAIWDSSEAAEGDHVIRVRAYDSASNYTDDSITVSKGDSTGPTVNITAPSDNSTVSGNVAIAATATDDTAVQRLFFYVDNVLIRSDALAPYGAVWNASAATEGAHSIRVRAYDTSGNFTDESIDVTVGDATGPSVSITAPSDGATVSGSVLITANAADESGISRVWFYIDGVAIRSDALAPYAAIWSANLAGAGPHEIRVRAYDNNGNFSDAVIDVTVGS